MSACCAPRGGHRNHAQSDDPVPISVATGPVRPASSGLVPLPGGRFRMGSEDPWSYPEDGEGPVREAEVAGFAIDPHCVSNERFAAFVAATGYVTDAERFGASFVFGGLLPDDFPPTRGVLGAEWWREVPGANWWHPEGPQSDVGDRVDHPVVHVTWWDANAYCAWAGLRLPTEPQWEYAARGGLEGCWFPWGNKLRPNGEHRMNVWQGAFPLYNTLGDGYLGTAPVDAFAPNGFGLFNMTGNVWEWTGDSFDVERRALRGGSYLCHASYCRRFRVSARIGSTPDSSSGNVGFRCVA
jgi:sulfatase modifying factor 1